MKNGSSDVAAENKMPKGDNDGENGVPEPGISLGTIFDIEEEQRKAVKPKSVKKGKTEKKEKEEDSLVNSPSIFDELF